MAETVNNGKTSDNYAARKPPLLVADCEGKMQNENSSNTTPPADEPTVLVFDIPAEATPQELERAINERCPFGSGWFLVTLYPWPGAGTRVIVRRSIVVGVKTGAESKPKRTKDDIAMQYLRDHREMDRKELVGALKAIGYPRSLAWVSDRCREIIRADRRLS